MTSEARTPRPAVPGRGRAFVWTWPAGRTRPVVAGALARDGDRYRFNYARSWLARADAVPLHVPELPRPLSTTPRDAGCGGAPC